MCKATHYLIKEFNRKGNNESVQKTSTQTCVTKASVSRQKTHILLSNEIVLPNWPDNNIMESACSLICT